jgi:endonuclease/exonuclease/phosphatase family metal-dependent hydrolase
MPKERLRIATWNLWWRFGPWESRQPAIVETMRRVAADVWCLQEVYATRDGEDQAVELAEALGGYHVAHVSRFDLAEFDQSIGNAVLSRWPITDHEMRALPAPDGLDELRCVMRADVAAPHHALEVFVTHLNWRMDQSHVRQEQVRAICEFVAESRDRREFPPLLCGDFNAVPDSEEIRMLTGLTAVPVPKLVFIDAWRAGGDGPGITWDNRNEFAADEYEPDGRIDYVFVGYPRDVGVGHVESASLIGDAPVDGTWPSDHFGVFADVRLEPVINSISM